MSYYILFTTICTLFLFIWIVKRITAPLTCACGYSTWFIGSFKKHLLQGHKWIDHG